MILDTLNTLDNPTTGEARALDQIEQAASERPFCEACGAPTTPIQEGDEIWLCCAKAQETKPILRRILSFEPLLGHTRQLVLEDLTERLAA